ncbi:MAG TPA: dihydropteroate synthase, partial [Solirubrobacterales bacterium]|nr:dihydropteroate synthase [Solirubrobacterales bacterium]
MLPDGVPRVPSCMVMGVVNATPDSFSDGGRLADAGAAAERGRELSRLGAAIVDVGGESTRPGAAQVTVEEELARVVPVIEALAPAPVAISVDTSKLAVAEAALAAGATIVNDVTSLRGDPEIAALCAEQGAGLVLVHMRGSPRTMQRSPRYGDVVAEVRAALVERVELAVAEGVLEERIWVDPGIGFGKLLGHNLELLRHLGAFAGIGGGVLVGTSRKSFIGD